ncbi:MAG: ABC transporter ATP-binding protein [Pirellulales bacterium]
MTGLPILEARRASLVYATPRGPLAAVDDVSLRIARGECVAILGRSGSGKSTLLALLAGLTAPTSGDVLFAGQSWRARTPAATSAARAGGSGLLFQDGGLLPGLRAFDNVLLPMVLAGVPQAVAASRATELLGQVGLRDRWDAYPAELSGGQHRRVALARALAAEPSAILADEPTGDLDGLAAREIIALLQRVRDTRTTALVVVTHDPTLASIADSCVWIERGRCATMAADTPHPAGLPALLPAELEPRGECAFEPPPADLVSVAPTTSVARMAGSWLPFLAGVAICGAVVALIDGLIASRQATVVVATRNQRRLAEEMAMQDLRADIDDVVVDTAGVATVTAFLQNYRPDRPLHVLGPTVDVSIQRGGRWDSVSIVGEGPEDGIRTIGGEKTLLPVQFTVPEGPYDELMLGYLHVRIGAAMVVSDQPNGSGDLFERLDAYYIYLRDPRRTETDIRRANGWGDKATVPLWIAMPSH